MGRRDIPSNMTATQVNVLVGVRDRRVYRKEDGLGRDFMDDGTGIDKGVGRQVTTLLVRKYIVKGEADSLKRAYYGLTPAGEKIAQGL